MVIPVETTPIAKLNHSAALYPWSNPSLRSSIPYLLVTAICMAVATARPILLPTWPIVEYIAAPTAWSSGATDLMMKMDRHGMRVSAPSVKMTIAGKPYAQYVVSGGVRTAKSRQGIVTQMVPHRTMTKPSTVLRIWDAIATVITPVTPDGMKRRVVCMTLRF